MARSVLVKADVDQDVEARAAEILQRLGLTVPDAVRMMLTRTAAEGRLPFALEGADDTHDAWFRQMVREALDDRSGDLAGEAVEGRMARKRAALEGRTANGDA